jgi:hypothetical protein
MEAIDLESIFFLPLSRQAWEEFQQLREVLQEIPYDDNSKDIWQPIWGCEYSSKKFYMQLFKGIQAHGIFEIIWKSKCTPRIKIFTWLILVDRLNTKTMLRRRNIGDRPDDNCVLCSTGEEETIEHLFFSCPFASLCWGVSI